MCITPGVEFAIDGDPIFSDYRLSIWSAWTRVRDERICQLCLNDVEEKSTYLQAHHIFPKHEYPLLAYAFANAISLCVKCHLRVTHSDDRNVTRFRMLFYARMNNRYVREFNLRYQHKVGEADEVFLPTQETLDMYGISKGWSRLILAPTYGYESTGIVT